MTSTHDDLPLATRVTIPRDSEQPTPLPLAAPRLPQAKPRTKGSEDPVPAVLRSQWSDFLQTFGKIGSAVEWCFGVVSLILGLALIATIPVLQFLSLGYLLECGGRMARTGRFRDGFIGIRTAARLGTIALGTWLWLLPARFFADWVHSASIINPGGTKTELWRVGLIVWLTLTLLHIVLAIAMGGKIRHFLSPINLIFVVLKITRGGFYQRSRDQVWELLVSLRLAYYWMLGLKGFLVGAAWLVIPVSLLALGRWHVGIAPLLAFFGAFQLCVVVMYIPFVQLQMAMTGRFWDGFNVTATRDAFRRSPMLFAIAFFCMILFALPLYILKMEVVPQDAAWLPNLFFVALIYPSRLLAGWALARATWREQPRHLIFRWSSRIMLLVLAAFYVLITYFTQYTSWYGIWSLYEHHAFLLPVPFLSL